MNKTLLAIVMASTVALSACGDKDEAYYLQHPEKATEKHADCDKKLAEILFSADKDKIKELKEDKECLAARSALKTIREQEWEAKRKAEEAERQAKIDEAKKAMQSKYADKDWKEVAKAFAGSECGGYISDYDFNCKAFKAIYDEKTAPAKAELIAQNDLPSLIGLKKEFCGVDQRRYSACTVWGEAAGEKAKAEFEKLDYAALAEQNKLYCDDYSNRIDSVCNALNEVKEQKKKVLVSQYVENTDAFKQDYNQCVDRVKNLSWSKKYEIISKYPCDVLREAHSELRLPYNDFDKKIE